MFPNRAIFRLYPHFLITILTFICPILTLQAAKKDNFNISASKSTLSSDNFCDSERLIYNNLANDAIKTVVIDAGHGGHDPGCHGGHAKEKHLNLSMAKKVGTLISAIFPEVRVIYTRETDVFITLEKRAKIANENNADLFISIHCNFLPNVSSYSGTETYVLGLHRKKDNLAVAMRENASIQLEDDYQNTYQGFDPKSAESYILMSMVQSASLDNSILFAQLVEQQFSNFGRTSRGVQQAGFLVLRETTMPSVLIETGYLSNKRERNYLASSDGQDEVANAILNAFRAYKEHLELGTALPDPATLQAQRESRPVVQTQEITAAEPEEEEEPIQEISQPKPSSTRQAVRRTDPEPTPQFVSNTREVQNTEAVIYKVQLAAALTEIDLRIGKWARADGITVSIEEGKYKYTKGQYSSLSEASSSCQNMKNAGFRDAFVVAYRNGKRITMAEAQQE